MATLQQLRHGVDQAWDGLLDGWQKLYRRAGGAITRFTAGRFGGAGAQDGHELVARGSGWGVLAAEVYDAEDKVVVCLEAPGMQKNDFDVQVIGNHLVVRGEKHVTRERTAGRYQISECAYGSFDRAIALPEDVGQEQASASYKRGVLRVELAKSPALRRKSIKVVSH